MGKHEMITLDVTGHTSVTWEPSNDAEVEIARTSFDTYIRKGYRAFRMTGNNEQGSRMDTFDASAAKVMFVPQLQGG